LDVLSSGSEDPMADDEVHNGDEESRRGQEKKRRNKWQREEQDWKRERDKKKNLKAKKKKEKLEDILDPTGDTSAAAAAADKKKKHIRGMLSVNEMLWAARKKKNISYYERKRKLQYLRFHYPHRYHSRFASLLLMSLGMMCVVLG